MSAKWRIAVRSVLGALALGVALSACGGGGSPPPAPPDPPSSQWDELEWGEGTWR